MKQKLTDENKPAWYRGLFWVLLVDALFACVAVLLWPYVEWFFMAVWHELRYQLWLLSLVVRPPTP